MKMTKKNKYVLIIAGAALIYFLWKKRAVSKADAIQKATAGHEADLSAAQTVLAAQRLAAIADIEQMDAIAAASATTLI